MFLHVNLGRCWEKSFGQFLHYHTDTHNDGTNLTREPETAAAEGFHEESALIISVGNNGSQTVAIPFGELNSVWF